MPTRQSSAAWQKRKRNIETSNQMLMRNFRKIRNLARIETK